MSPPPSPREPKYPVGTPHRRWPSISTQTPHGHDSISILERVERVSRNVSAMIGARGYSGKSEDTMADLAFEPTQHTVRRRAGRPSLGDREHLTAALWPSLEALIDAERGGLNRSPFLADLLAWHVGRPDVIRHPQLAIQFCTDDAVRDAPKPPGPKTTRHCTMRVHPDVARALDQGARDSGLPRAAFIAQAIAESLGVRRTRATTQDARLPLAI